jgi:hypothetical protein
MIRTFSHDKSSGSMTAHGHFSGALGQMETMTGSGEVKIDNGDITQIYFLGPLTPLIPGFSVADAAHGDFTVAKGGIHTDDLHISSEFFALIGNGDYNFMTDQLNLDMRVNGNAFLGVFLYPLSKTFEYHGSGPMKNPKWVPKNF